MTGRETAAGTKPAAGTAVSPPDWPEICVRYARLVYSIPRKFGLDQCDCDDVFQATWLTAVRRNDPPREEIHLVRWLAAIAAWESRNLMRRRRPRAADPSTFQDLPSAAADRPDRMLADVEEQRILVQALGALTPRDRAILESLFLAETPLSYGEIAARIGVQIGSVGPLRMRALERLKDELKRRDF